MAVCYACRQEQQQQQQRQVEEQQHKRQQQQQQRTELESQPNAKHKGKNNKGKKAASGSGQLPKDLLQNGTPEDAAGLQAAEGLPGRAESAAVQDAQLVSAALSSSIKPDLLRPSLPIMPVQPGAQSSSRLEVLVINQSSFSLGYLTPRSEQYLVNHMHSTIGTQWSVPCHEEDLQGNHMSIKMCHISCHGLSGHIRPSQKKIHSVNMC